MKAYRRARRLSVPVRVRGTTRAEALMVSKMVNCDGAKLPLHRDQQRESAWQYLAAATSQGRRGLPEGESLRSIGGAFGVDKSTVGRMVKRLPQVSPADYQPDACDPGTGWPQWKHVRGNACRDRFADVPEDVRERHRDERRAAQMAKIIERDGRDAFLRSLRLLADDAISEAGERLAEVYEGEADY
ncbi:hypothetical protein B1L07_10050 [Stenotrophomonas acidaminiphila]|nr:hypothetical protein B1L07_10050 [Stenotrophomonas acidaminiphila]